MLKRLGLAAVLSVAGLAACGGDSGMSDSAAKGDGGAKANTVEMKLIAFRPDSLTISPGETITWRQSDAGAHTVTSGTVRQEGGSAIAAPDGRFDSGEIATGGTYRQSFDEAGTYPYFCALHPATMRGQITVT